MAIFFAYLLEPVVGWFTRRFRGRRSHAIVATYTVFLIGLGLFAATLGPKIVSEAERLAQSLPSMVENVSSGQIALQFGGQHGWSFETQLRLQRLLAAHKDAGSRCIGSRRVQRRITETLGSERTRVCSQLHTQSEYASTPQPPSGVCYRRLL